MKFKVQRIIIMFTRCYAIMKFHLPTRNSACQKCHISAQLTFSPILYLKCYMKYVWYVHVLVTCGVQVKSHAHVIVCSIIRNLTCCPVFQLQSFPLNSLLKRMYVCMYVCCFLTVYLIHSSTQYNHNIFVYIVLIQV